jgi:hypothetical protein
VISEDVFPSSICHRCTAHRYVRTKTSTFIMCTALEKKYPPQPVLACPAFTEDSDDQDDKRETASDNKATP